jgi:hypothetical protein
MNRNPEMMKSEAKWWIIADVLARDEAYSIG